MPMSMPLVSILIPAFNAERWLPQTVRSALAQSWPRVEVVIVDDGSTDRTLSVARTFEGSAVKVVTQRNAGPAAARNRALEIAQGSYLQWLDADDLLHPDKIRLQMTAARLMSNPLILLAGAVGAFYFRPRRAVFTATALWCDATPVDYFLTRFNHNVFLQTGSWLVSRELSAAAGPWTELDSPDDDGEYFCRVVSSSAGVKFVREARSYYRIGDLRSVNNARSTRAQTALFQSKVKCIEYLLALENSPRTRAAATRLLQDWLPEFYPDRTDILAAAAALASRLGGELRLPRVKPKYRAVESLFGRSAAWRASAIMPRIRAQAARQWERLLDQTLPAADLP